MPLSNPSTSSTELAYAQITSAVTSTATTEGAAAVVVTAPTITFDGLTTIIVEFWAQAWESPSAGDIQAQLALYDNGSSIGPVAFGNVTASSTTTTFFDHPVYTRRRLTPSAGDHAYSIRLYGGTGTKTVYAGAGGSGVDAPAFIRISRA